MVNTLAYIQEEMPFNEHVTAKYEEVACLRILDTIFKLETEGKIDTYGVLDSALKLRRTSTEPRLVHKVEVTTGAINKPNLPGDKLRPSVPKPKNRKGSHTKHLKGPKGK